MITSLLETLYFACTLDIEDATTNFLALEKGTIKSL
jgi:hypothetical protein